MTQNPNKVPHHEHRKSSSLQAIQYSQPTALNANAELKGLLKSQTDSFPQDFLV